MPKLTRKYPSTQKTTTPEGYREYKKFQMRERRAQQKPEVNRLRNRIPYLEMDERLTKQLEKTLNASQ